MGRMCERWWGGIGEGLWGGCVRDGGEGSERGYGEDV